MLRAKSLLINYFSISVLDNADVSVKDILNHLDVDALNRRGGHDGVSVGDNLDAKVKDILNHADIDVLN